MKSGSSSGDTELAIGILIFAILISGEMKGYSMLPLGLWLFGVLLVIPVVDKFVLASTFENGLVRCLLNLALFLLLTGVCLKL